jgi:nanoRNase/pAp phosphatase (c-di-AMP/oligoRNAs hydrolase)
MKNYNVSEIKNLMSSAKTALVVVPNLSIDSLASGLALALSLKKNNIETKVFCPQKPDDNYSKLSGLELVSDSFNQNDLVVTLDYPVEQIETVNYNQDNGKLNLVIQTKPGSPKVAQNQILVANQTGVSDINFILGDESLLADKANIVNSGTWIQISPTNNVKSWAKASLVDQDAPYSEIFTFLLPMLGLNFDADVAKDLLIGLRVATQSFSINVSPETFEAGAVCLRATQPAMNNSTQNPQNTNQNNSSINPLSPPQNQSIQLNQDNKNDSNQSGPNSIPTA